MDLVSATNEVLMMGCQVLRAERTLSVRSLVLFPGHETGIRVWSGWKILNTEPGAAKLHTLIKYDSYLTLFSLFVFVCKSFISTKHQDFDL